MQVANLSGVSYPIQYEAQIRAMGDGEQPLAQEVRLRVSAHGDVLDISTANPGDLEYALDGHGREPGPMLHPAKALFLDCRDESAISEQRRRHVPVIRIDAQHVRRHSLLLCRRPSLLPAQPALEDQRIDEKPEPEAL